jgi:hypothetical protein
LGLILPNIDDITIELSGSGTTDSEIDDWYSDADAEQIVNSAADWYTFYYIFDANGGTTTSFIEYMVADADMNYSNGNAGNIGLAKQVLRANDASIFQRTWPYGIYKIYGNYAKHTPYVYWAVSRNGYDLTGIYETTHGGSDMYSTDYSVGNTTGRLFDCGMYYGDWANHTRTYNRANRLRTNGEGINLRAQWQPHTCTVYYRNADNTTATVKTYTYDVSPYRHVLEGKICTKKGYTQTGWKDTWGNTYPLNCGIINLWIENVHWNGFYTACEMWPTWTPNTYTVNFNKNGGTGGTNSVTATFDSAMPGINIPT